MEMMFTRKGSPASLRRKLDMHFKILSLDLDGNLTFIQKRLRVKEGCPRQSACSEGKENISEGMCKADLLGQVSAQRDLCRVFKKNPTGAAR